MNALTETAAHSAFKVASAVHMNPGKKKIRFQKFCNALLTVPYSHNRELKVVRWGLSGSIHNNFEHKLRSCIR